MFFPTPWNTHLVFAGVRDLGQAVTLLWTFKLPWNWAYHGTLFDPGARSSPSASTVSCSHPQSWANHDGPFKPRSWC